MIKQRIDSFVHSGPVARARSALRVSWHNGLFAGLAVIAACSATSNKPTASDTAAVDTAADGTLRTGWWIGDSLAFLVENSTEGPEIRELYLISLSCNNADLVDSEGQKPCSAPLDGAVYLQPAVTAAAEPFTWNDGKGIHWTGSFTGSDSASGELEVFDTTGRCCIAELAWNAEPATQEELKASPVFANCGSTLEVRSIEVVALDLADLTTEVVDGAEVPVVAGPQGALMIRLHASGGYELSTSGLSARLGIRVSDGSVGATVQALANPFSSAGSPTNGAGTQTESEWHDIWAVLTSDSGSALNPVVPGDIEQIDGANAVIEAVVFSPCGQFAAHSAEVTLRYE